MYEHLQQHGTGSPPADVSTPRGMKERGKPAENGVLAPAEAVAEEHCFS